MTGRDRNDCVLIVEDNPGDARLVQEAFNEVETAWTIEHVDDGGKAIDRIRRRGAHFEAPVPRLVLLDLDIPTLHGLEVLEHVKSDRALRTIPVIVFTSSDSPADVREAYELGANAYIVKPASLEEYVETVEAIDRFWRMSTLSPLEKTQ